MQLITVNFKKYAVDMSVHTLIQRCELLSIMIPRFCFHEKLSIAGNCRMCIVEVNSSPKPVVSCSTKVVNGLEVLTNSILIKRIREHIIEFLLINHPLDCPICDQGGECDLQDQTLIYGSDRGRFREIKRSVFDKNFGPFIKTVMTRCIHCTKCVRFVEEYGDSAEIGTLGRGGDTEIGLYSSAIVHSELSGNIIDLCPVGALTSKPYAFKARSWELVGTESLDIFDSFGSNILIQTRSNEILRILPRRNDALNENWITDQIRFGYDSFKNQRLLVPYTRLPETGKIVPVSWRAGISFFTFNFLQLSKYSVPFSESCVLFQGSTVDLETSYAIKQFSMEQNIVILNTIVWVNANKRAAYLMSQKIVDVEFLSVSIILGLNFKVELPLLNLKFKKSTHSNSVLYQHTTVYYVGSPVNSNINIKQVGFSNRVVINTFYGKNTFSLVVKQHCSISLFYRVATNVCSGWESYFPEQLVKVLGNSICLKTGEIHSMEVNTQPLTLSLLNVLKKHIPVFSYVIGLTLTLNETMRDCFTVYQGSNFSESSTWYNLFFPSTNFTEGSIRLFMNCEGRLQRTFPAVTRPGHAVRDTTIIQILTRHLNSTSFVNGVYNKKCYLLWTVPFLKKVNCNHNYMFKIESVTTVWLTNSTYMPSLKEFHGSSIYYRASSTLSKMSLYKRKNTNFINL